MEPPGEECAIEVAREILMRGENARADLWHRNPAESRPVGEQDGESRCGKYADAVFGLGVEENESSASIANADESEDAANPGFS